MKALRSLLISIVCVLGIATVTLTQTGCTTTNQATAQRTLLAVGLSVDAAMQGASDLHAQGHLAPEKWAQIKTFFDTKYRPAFVFAEQAARGDLSTVSPAEVSALSLQLLTIISQLSAKPATP